MCGICVAQSFIFCVVGCRSLFDLCPFSFGHCIICPSIYGLWLPLWYLQNFINTIIPWSTTKACIMSTYDLHWISAFESLFVKYVGGKLLPVFSGVPFTRSLTCNVCRSFCPFSFGHCVVCVSIYGFWSSNSDIVDLCIKTYLSFKISKASFFVATLVHPCGTSHRVLFTNLKSGIKTCHFPVKYIKILTVLVLYVLSIIWNNKNK